MNLSTCTATSSIISTRCESFSIEIMGFSIILFLLILVGGSFKYHFVSTFNPKQEGSSDYITFRGGVKFYTPHLTFEPLMIEG